MARKKQDKPIKVDPYAEYRRYEGKRYSVQFGTHEPVESTLTIVEKRNVSGNNLAPNKRFVDGKLKSPAIFSLVFEDFRLTFVQEDIHHVSEMNGFQIICGDTVIYFTEVTA